MKKKGFTCKEEYFDAINRCDIMDMAYFNDGSVHECSRGDNHAYPLVDEGKIFIKDKVSPWRRLPKPIKKTHLKNPKEAARVGEQSLVGSFCKSKPKAKTASRLCPCIKEDVVPKSLSLLLGCRENFYQRSSRCVSVLSSACAFCTLFFFF